MKRLALALIALPTVAVAQAPQDMVLIPREVAQAALTWIGAPDATTAVKIFATLNACMNDNPHDGKVVRFGQDMCPSVTDALAARDKQISDLEKKLAEKGAPDKAPAK